MGSLLQRAWAIYMWRSILAKWCKELGFVKVFEELEIGLVVLIRFGSETRSKSLVLRVRKTVYCDSLTKAGRGLGGRHRDCIGSTFRGERLVKCRSQSLGVDWLADVGGTHGASS